jgi:5-methylcytosine-specific restriction enzyme A
MQLAAEPLCEQCLSRTRVTVATEVHHKVPVLVRADLALDVANLQSLCTDCHDAIDKTRTRW